MDRGAARIAARRAEDIHLLPGPREDIFKAVAQELHGDIFERQRRPVEEFEDMNRPDGNRRRNFRVPERGIAAIDQLAQIGIGNIDEQPQELERDVLIGKLGPRLQPVLDLGNALGNQQAAVGRQPGNHGILKSHRRSFTARADVLHGFHRSRILRSPTPKRKQEGEEQRNTAA